MARDTDRKKISEAVRLQDLWRIDELNRDYVELITDYDERLYVDYDRAGAVKSATYLHYDEHGEVASREQITLKKRERVLTLINQKDVS